MRDRTDWAGVIVSGGVTLLMAALIALMVYVELWQLEHCKQYLNQSRIQHEPIVMQNVGSQESPVWITTGGDAYNAYLYQCDTGAQVWRRNAPLQNNW